MATRDAAGPGVTCQDTAYLVPLGKALGASVSLDSLPGVDMRRARALRALGYENCRISDMGSVELCDAAIGRSEEFAEAKKYVDVVIHSLGPVRTGSDRDLSWFFRAHEFAPARVFGLTPRHCASFLAQIDLGLALMAGGGARTTLGLLAGQAAGEPPRVKGTEHLQSDGAYGFLVTADPGAGSGYRILAHRMTYEHPADHLPDAHRLDASRRTALKAVHLRRLAQEALAAAGLRAADIDHFVVQNLGVARMQGLAELCGVPAARAWLGSLPVNGHVIAADSLINLHDLHHWGGMAGDATVMVIGTSKTAMGVVILQGRAARPAQGGTR